MEKERGEKKQKKAEGSSPWDAWLNLPQQTWHILPLRLSSHFKFSTLESATHFCHFFSAHDGHWVTYWTQPSRWELSPGEAENTVFGQEHSGSIKWWLWYSWWVLAALKNRICQVSGLEILPKPQKKDSWYLRALIHQEVTKRAPGHHVQLQHRSLQDKG